MCWNQSRRIESSSFQTQSSCMTCAAEFDIVRNFELLTSVSFIRSTNGPCAPISGCVACADGGNPAFRNRSCNTGCCKLTLVLTNSRLNTSGISNSHLRLLVWSKPYRKLFKFTVYSKGGIFVGRRKHMF